MLILPPSKTPKLIQNTLIKINYKLENYGCDQNSGRIYYPLSYLEDLDFTLAVAPGIAGGLNPETGGILEITAPGADSTDSAAAQSEITAPEQGLAQSPQLSDQGIAKTISGTQGSAGSILLWIAAAAVLLAGSVGIFWFLKRRTQE